MTGMNSSSGNAGVSPVPITLDWFKNNCAILENAIATDFSDPVNDLTLVESWIIWVESPHSPPDCLRYFYEVCLLKIVNSLLTKKYQNVELHIIRTKETLKRIAEALGRQLSYLPEFVTEIMLVLFHQKHPFYLKYGYPKISKPFEVISSKSIEDQSWIASLVAGDCIDGKNSSGDWEIIVIDELSPVGTEINVTWSSGVSEWLRLEDNLRIAKFGTKTGVYVDTSVLPEYTDSPPAPKPAPQVVEIPEIGEEKVVCSNLIFEEDAKWRNSLIVGDLIDAKDKSGTWYQACILEFVRMEFDSSTQASIPIQTTSDDVETPQITLDDQNTATLKKELFATQSHASQDTVESVNPHLITAETKVSATLIGTYVRVCYLGWLEYYDDWIDLSASTGRIAPLNSQSFGSRGDNIVREEIKFLAKFWEKKKECREPSLYHFADSTSHALVSPFYAEVIDRFLTSSGFTNLQSILNQFSMGNIDMKRHFHQRLIVAIGFSAEVLSHFFFSSPCCESDIFSALVSYIEQYVRFLLREDLRATKTETIEQLIVSLEKILKAGGKTILEVSNFLDPIWLNIASECIRCPFLNRRLGGLKILTDLLHRFEQSILYPNFLRVTRSITSPSSSSNVPTSSTTFSASSFLAMTSYTFVPPCSVHAEGLCKFILEILPFNFIGESAHEALMQRSSDMLKFLCQHNSFSPNLLNTLWDLGSNHSNAVVLQIIQELVPISLSLDILCLLGNHIVSMAPSSVTIQIADILSAIALRCRSLLLDVQKPPIPNLVTSKIAYSHDIFEDGQEEKVPVINLFIIQDLHRICLSTLYSWAEDNSNVNDSVAIKCVSKVETVLDLGINSSVVVQSGCKFPWTRHWQRGVNIVLRAIDCLKQHCSILLSVKTIRAFFLSWIKEDDYIKANIFEVKNLESDTSIPIDYFYRHHVSQYIEEQYHLLKIITDVIVYLKNSFNVAAKGIILDSSSQSHAYKVSSELQAVLNELVIDASRTGYKDQIETLFDFIQFLVRSSPYIRLDFATIELIWHNLLLKAITPQERDLVFSFLNRLIINRSSLASLGTSNGMETKEPESSNAEANISQTFGRLSFFHPNTVQMIYNNLLSQNEFIMSDHFSPAAFLSVEKYYKWICASNNSIMELPGKDGGFIILKSLSTQSEWEIFPKIVMYCQDDKVALDAVKFLSMFPQRLSQSLVYAGDVVALRGLILSRSMTELEDIRNKTIGSDNLVSDHNLSSKLKRTLMLLNSLIDESSADSSKRVKSHSGKWKNKPIAIKIQYSKMNNMILTFDSSDTVEELLSGISRALSKEIQALKFFRRGAELAFNNAIKKTLQQIDMLANETIVVVDRPANGLANYTPNPPYVCPLESLPSVIISSTPKYLDILFSLMDITSGSICDDIWELIIRLPTSPNAFKYWKELIQTTTSISPDTSPNNSSSHLNFFSLNSNCEYPEILLEDSSVGKRMKITQSMSRLIYNLQIIETFFHSTKLEKSQSNNSSNAEDLDGEDSEDDEGLWVGIFITNNGIHSLEGVLSYVIQQCRFFCHCESSGCFGITPKLLLCGINLITKIFRGYIIRGVVCSRPRHFHEIQFLVKSMLQSLEIQSSSTPDDTSAANNIPKDKEDNSLPQYILDTPEVVDGTSMTIEQAQNAIIDALVEKELFISYEWGNKLNPHFDVSDSTSSAQLIDSTLDLREIQSLIYQFILTVPKFTSESFFYCENSQTSNLISIREAIQQTQNEYLQCVRNAFVIWGSIMIFNPDLALLISEQSAEELGMQLEIDSMTVPSLTGKQLLSPLLMGFPSINSFSNDSLNRFPSIVSGTSLLGLLIVMKLSERCLENNEFYLRNLFFHVLLDLRPSLLSSQDQNTNCENLFSFMTYLLSFESILKFTKFPPDIKFSMEETKLLEICQSIFQELIEIGNSIKVSQGSQPTWSGNDHREVSVRYLGGTMKLLRNLMKINQRSVDSLLPWGIVDYLIKICLGIHSTHSISLNILCHDAETRLQAYQILALFSTNFEVTSNILSQMNIAHASLEEPNQWSFNPARDVRSSVGYVGLKNMGCTCYMNSLLQVLYMNPVIRSAVASSDDPTDQSEEHLRDNLLYQLKKMFQFLLHSTRKAYLPDGWMIAYKDETGRAPVNVLNQQDAQEFLQVLCERMERLLVTKSSEGSVSLLNCLYSVQICDQVIKQNSSEDRSHSIREKNDIMMCISLDVRGTTGLENSLKKFVAGESISDYLWDENQPRVNIIKRQCIGKLSNSVIFHLKRFELNFDTFLREKVNDEFPFPMHIDLFPYTKEGLDGHSQTSSEYFYELTGIVVHTGTTDSGHYYSYIKESREDAKDRYLREHNCSTVSIEIPRRWIEFNDSEVQLFSETRIPAECFGGNVIQHEYLVSSQTWLTNNTSNPKSAYMLVYQKCHSNLTLGQSNESKVDESSDMELSVPVNENKPMFYSPPESVILDNQSHLLSSRCFTREHIEFMVSLEEQYLSLHHMYGCTFEEFLAAAPIIRINLCDFLSFLTRYVSRSLYQSSFEAGCDLIVNLLDNLILISQPPQNNQSSSYSDIFQSQSTQMSPSNNHEFNRSRLEFCVEICQTLLSNLMNHQGGLFLQNIIFAPDKAIRSSIAKFIYKLFVILINFEKDSDFKLKNISSTIMKYEILSPYHLSDLNLSMRDEIDLIPLLPLYVQFLLMITKNSFFMMCGEQWRRSDGFLWLLSQISQIRPSLRLFMIKREVILQLVDLFLADHSPLAGEYYIKGSRKRAPTSYVTLVSGKDGKMPNSAQNIPDWTDLLKTLSVLVRSTLTPCMIRMGFPPILLVSRNDAHILDQTTCHLLQSKILYTHALRQQRYISPIGEIISHLCYEDRMFSTESITDVITEGLSYATLESIAQYFELIKIFLSINDTLSSHRAMVLFDSPNGTILQIIKNYQQNKPQFVCITIESLFFLACQSRSVSFTLRNKLSEWAPWILKFCYQYVEKTSKDNLPTSVDGKSTESKGNESNKLKKGTFLRVFGESDVETELTHAERAVRTFELVQQVMRDEMRAYPDAYIPMDAFDVLPVETDDIPVETMAKILDEEKTSSNGVNNSAVVLSDAMTDEEFAKYLSQTLD